MIQIRKLRTFTPDGQTALQKYDKPMSPDITFKDLQSFKDNYQEAVMKIPESKRYNLFVTLHNQPDEPEARQKKVWGQQNLLMIDIDIPGDNKRDSELDKKYLNVVAKALKLDCRDLLQVYSGHGYHFVVELKTPITDVNYFSNNRLYFTIICSRINDLLQELKLEGEADEAVFAPVRMFRLPLTLNQKVGRDNGAVVLCSVNRGPVNLDLQKLSGLPKLKEGKDHIHANTKIKIDTASVESECGFLVYCGEAQADVTEAEWYAMVSITARMDDSLKLVHEYSEGHPKYSFEETEKKAQYSLQASGPRTCKNISTMYDGCQTCPHFGKVTTPLHLKAKGFIATAETGFHIANAKGILVPQPEDLLAYYAEEGFVNVNEQHYQWSGTHWDESEGMDIEAYAQQMYSPKPNNQTCKEFKGVVLRTNREKAGFFTTTTENLMNFKNGVLNTLTMEFGPHAREYGFTNTLAYNYDANASCPEFRKVLKDVSCNDLSIQTNLLQYMGYCLANGNPEADKALILTGSGSNGKSRFLNILKALAKGQSSAVGIGSFKDSFYLQRLDGSLFNITEEVPAFTKGDVWEILKSLITGDEIEVSQKFKDPYSFENKAKFIMTCNELPAGANQNKGYFRRLLIIPFNAEFSHANGNIDVHIISRIIANELSGVFNMAIAAFKDLAANNYKFEACAAAEAIQEEYRRDIDPVLRWYEDNMDVGNPAPGGEGLAPDFMFQTATKGIWAAYSDDLYAAYSQSCKDDGMSRACMKSAFIKRLRNVVKEDIKLSAEKRGTGDKGDNYKKIRNGAASKMGFSGMCWRL